MPLLPYSRNTSPDFNEVWYVSTVSTAVHKTQIKLLLTFSEMAHGTKKFIHNIKWGSHYDLKHLKYVSACEYIMFMCSSYL
jgi:hypothetical protein